MCERVLAVAADIEDRGHVPTQPLQRLSERSNDEAGAPQTNRLQL